MWKSATIGSVCSTYSGGTPSTSRSDYYGGDIPWIASADLNQRRIFSVKGRITKLGLDRSSAKMVDANTPLIALYGATAGVSAMTHIRGAINQAVLAMVPRNIDAEFLFQWLQANRDQIIDKYTQGGQPNLSGAIVRAIEMPLPGDAEQRRIAGVLRDTDDLIATLERLIVKKQAIKQGMMQQLLTGRTRLPGFTAPWMGRPLGDVARIKTGSRNNQDKKTGGKYPFFVRSATVERIDSYSYDCEAILVPGEGGIGSIFHYINGKFEVHQRVYKISDFANGVSGRFIYYYMCQYFGAYALGNSVKATVDSLRLPTFRNFLIQFPSYEEQESIVSILDDVEKELRVLRNRLTKARATKTGMMQQLLTGRTRLPVESDG